MKNLEEFEKHILDCYPQEGCGIVKDGIFIPIKNVHPNPAENFLFPEDLSFNLADESNYQILHSHTHQQEITLNLKIQILDARIPSKIDMKTQEQTDVPWGIVHCDGENVSDILWFGKPTQVTYEGRLYIPSVQDCFTIVRDYYYNELNFDMGSFPREIDWMQSDIHLMQKDYTEEGFKTIQYIEDLQKHDIVLFTIASRNLSHMGVYIGDGEFFHHLYNKKSCKDSISRWKNQFSKGLRYVKS